MSTQDDPNQDQLEPPALPDLPLKLSKVIPETKELYSIFQCSICYEPLRNPVMTVSCYHNFCSMCVRKYLLYKQQCPACFIPLHDPDLKPNRGLANAMEIIARLVPKLMALLKEVKPDFKLPTIKSSPVQPKTPKVSSIKKEAVNVSTSKSPQLNIKIIKTGNQTSENDFDTSRPSTSSANMDFPDSIAPGPSETGNRVPCPVCRVAVLEKNVNNHLDKCLAEQSGEIKKPEPTHVNHMRPLKQPIYHLLKDSEIKKRLKDQGLEAKGDRKVLVQRLKSFIALWNAQCDLAKPLTKLEMIMKLKKEERNLQQMPVIRTPSILNFDSKTDPELIESKQKEYVEKNKDHFKDLIAKARANKSKANLKKTSSGDENDENSILQVKPTNVTTEISDLQLTPKRKETSTSDLNFTPKPKEISEPSATPKQKVIPELSVTPKSNMIPEPNVTPKRKFFDLDSDETDIENSMPSPSLLSQTQQSSQQVSKKPRQLFDAPKPMLPKVLCPICNDSIAENLIQSHAERCLDKPEPRSSREVGKKKIKIKPRNEKSTKEKALVHAIEEDNDSSDDFDPDLFNATPDIILDEDEIEKDLICSTPIAAKENRRRITRKRAKEQGQGDSSPTL